MKEAHEIIKECMKEHGLVPGALAFITKISMLSMCKILSGTCNVTVMQSAMLGLALDKPPEYFFMLHSQKKILEEFSKLAKDIEEERTKVDIRKKMALFNLQNENYYKSSPNKHWKKGKIRNTHEEEVSHEDVASLLRDKKRHNKKKS